MIVNHGKICYLEIPATDIAVSSRFYSDVFGWTLREHDGHVSFDDSNGYVSGMWVEGRPPMSEAGIVISVMVDDAAASAQRVLDCGGSIVVPFDPDGAEKVAWFKDPGGNLMGIYEEPG